MIHRILLITALILSIAAIGFVVVLADLTDKRLRQLEQPPAAVVEGTKST